MILGGPEPDSLAVASFTGRDTPFEVTTQWVGDFALWATQPSVEPLVGDFNGDHLSDVALVGPLGSTLPVAFSMGDGTFNVTLETGRFAEARAAFAQALAITEEVVPRDPGNLFFQSDLSACHAFLGRVHELQGDLQPALAEVHADVAINEHLIAKQPDNGSWRGFLGDALTNEGRALMGLRRLDEALTRHQRALQADHDDARAQADVAESLLERGRVHARLGRAEAARVDWTRAADLLTAALRTSDYVVHRLRYARTLLELGDLERARPAVERLLRERSNEPELLELCKRHGLLA